MDPDDDDDTIPGDPDEEAAALAAEHVTDGTTPDENREVGVGVEDG